MKVALIGCGGLAREIIACFQKQVCFPEIWDDGLLPGSNFNGIPVRGSVEMIPNNYHLPFVIGIGNPIVRKKLHGIVKEKNGVFHTLIHQDAIIYHRSGVVMEQGCLLMPSSYLTTEIKLEENVLLHIGAGIHHDVVVGAHSVLMPGSRITCQFQTPECFFLDSLEAVSIKTKELYM